MKFLLSKYYHSAYRFREQGAVNKAGISSKLSYLLIVFVSATSGWTHNGNRYAEIPSTDTMVMIIDICI